MTRRLLNCQRLLGMVVTMLCLLGIAAYSTMPRQEDPSFPYRAGMITVSYPGASAEAVERLVLQPLTDELRQVEELDWSQTQADDLTDHGACDGCLRAVSWARRSRRSPSSVSSTTKTPSSNWLWRSATPDPSPSRRSSKGKSGIRRWLVSPSA